MPPLSQLYFKFPGKLRSIGCKDAFSKGEHERSYIYFGLRNQKFPSVFCLSCAIESLNCLRSASEFEYQTLMLIQDLHDLANFEPLTCMVLKRSGLIQSLAVSLITALKRNEVSNLVLDGIHELSKKVYDLQLKFVLALEDPLDPFRKLSLLYLQEFADDDALRGQARNRVLSLFADILHRVAKNELLKKTFSSVVNLNDKVQDFVQRTIAELGMNTLIKSTTRLMIVLQIIQFFATNATAFIGKPAALMHNLLQYLGSNCRPDSQATKLLLWNCSRLSVNLSDKDLQQFRNNEVYIRSLCNVFKRIGLKLDPGSLEHLTSIASKMCPEAIPVLMSLNTCGKFYDVISISVIQTCIRPEYMMEILRRRTEKKSSTSKATVLYVLKIFYHVISTEAVHAFKDHMRYGYRILLRIVESETKNCESVETLLQDLPFEQDTFPLVLIKLILSSPQCKEKVSTELKDATFETLCRIAQTQIGKSARIASLLLECVQLAALGTLRCREIITFFESTKDIHVAAFCLAAAYGMLNAELSPSEEVISLTEYCENTFLPTITSRFKDDAIEISCYQFLANMVEQMRTVSERKSRNFVKEICSCGLITKLLHNLDHEEGSSATLLLAGKLLENLQEFEIDIRWTQAHWSEFLRKTSCSPRFLLEDICHRQDKYTSQRLFMLSKLFEYGELQPSELCAKSLNLFLNSSYSFSSIDVLRSMKIVSYFHNKKMSMRPVLIQSTCAYHSILGMAEVKELLTHEKLFKWIYSLERQGGISSFQDRLTLFALEQSQDGQLEKIITFTDFGFFSLCSCICNLSRDKRKLNAAKLASHFMKVMRSHLCKEESLEQGEKEALWKTVEIMFINGWHLDDDSMLSSSFLSFVNLLSTRTSMKSTPMHINFISFVVEVLRERESGLAPKVAAMRLLNTYILKCKELPNIGLWVDEAISVLKAVFSSSSIEGGRASDVIGILLNVESKLGMNSKLRLPFIAKLCDAVNAQTVMNLLKNGQGTMKEEMVRFFCQTSDHLLQELCSDEFMDVLGFVICEIQNGLSFLSIDPKVAVESYVRLKDNLKGTRFNVDSDWDPVVASIGMKECTLRSRNSLPLIEFLCCASDQPDGISKILDWDPQFISNFIRVIERDFPYSLRIHAKIVQIIQWICKDKKVENRHIECFLLFCEALDRHMLVECSSSPADHLKNLTEVKDSLLELLSKTMRHSVPIKHNHQGQGQSSLMNDQLQSEVRIVKEMGRGKNGTCSSVSPVNKYRPSRNRMTTTHVCGSFGASTKPDEKQGSNFSSQTVHETINKAIKASSLQKVDAFKNVLIESKNSASFATKKSAPLKVYPSDDDCKIDECSTEDEDEVDMSPAEEIDLKAFEKGILQRQKD